MTDKQKNDNLNAWHICRMKMIKQLRYVYWKNLSEINLGIVMKVYFPENGCANMKNNKIYFME